MSRRRFGAAMAMLVGSRARAEGQAANTTAQGSSPNLKICKVFAPTLAEQPNGSSRWQALTGTVATGEAVSIHESVVPAGTAKSAAHVIQHSEFVFVVEGTLSFQHDGLVEQAGTGSIVYVAYGTEHLVWNPGATAARYFVLQLGGDTKKA